MKIKILLFVMLFVLAISGKAQTKDAKPFNIGVGAMVGLPIGDTGLAYGVDLMGEFTVAPSFALTVSAGYGDGL